MCYNVIKMREGKPTKPERKTKMKLTVKELKEILNKYNDNDFVEVEGGEDSYGEWSQLLIDGDVIIDN